MKKRLIILLAVINTQAAQYDENPMKVADPVFLERQLNVLKLFNHIHQLSYHKEFLEIENNFKFEDRWEQWTKPEYAKEFYNYYKNDRLLQGKIFSIHNPKHLEQAIALFRTFYYAKDYDTMHKTAVWARQNVNEGMFVYAYTIAITHHKWTHDLLLPPIYEIFPNYFFSEEVIRKARQHKQHHKGERKQENKAKTREFKGYTVHSNYTFVNTENDLSYFTEDIGVNSYYYYLHIYMPFWMDTRELHYVNHFRGEFFYWVHQQLLARYYLERLSNELGEISSFSYDYPIEHGYSSSLMYFNGEKFPKRQNHAKLVLYDSKQSSPWFGNYSYSYTHIEDYERRLRDAIDLGYLYTSDGKAYCLFDQNGFEILGNLIQHNTKSLNPLYYGDLIANSKNLLGFSCNYSVPSVLENFETAMRDPMFYRLYKRILDFFNRHQNHQGPYKKEQLYFDGVQIEEIKFDRIVTYFDYFYSDLRNAVIMDQRSLESDSFNIRARQYRLNHKPFTYKITIKSDAPTESFIKVFIGPKRDEDGRKIPITENYMNFFEIDRFHYTLATGKNIIERNSQENRYFSYDRSSYLEMYYKIITSIQGEAEFKYYTHNWNYYGFPDRLMLPKGSESGKPFQVYIIAVPYHKPKKEGSFFVDHDYSIGYPFDRPIKYEHVFLVPNSIFKDIYIHHKNLIEDVDEPIDLN